MSYEFCVHIGPIIEIDTSATIGQQLETIKNCCPVESCKQFGKSKNKTHTFCSTCSNALRNIEVDIKDPIGYYDFLQQNDEMYEKWEDSMIIRPTKNHIEMLVPNGRDYGVTFLGEGDFDTQEIPSTDDLQTFVTDHAPLIKALKVFYGEDAVKVRNAICSWYW